MPKAVDTRFLRQRAVPLQRIGVVIPGNATMKPDLAERVNNLGLDLGKPTEPPHSFSFHYIDYPPDESLLEDGAIVDSGVYKFTMRDAVIGVFDLPALQDDEFSWSFSTTSQIDVLAALRVGETFDVDFEKELEEAYHITKYHFPSGIPDSGYGEYAIHLSVDGLNGQGFRVVSAYEPQSKRTSSRLPFFFGFRAFGRSRNDPEYPIWRELLGQAVREALFQRWQHCLLYTAFSLESFTDRQLADKLEASAVGDTYIEHVLRVGEKRYELHALNAPGGRLSKSEVNKAYDRLNKYIFTHRNRLAHGKANGADITAEIAVRAIKTTVEFIWDWDRSARSLLLPQMRVSEGFEAMIDEALLTACQEGAQDTA
jgi:hypothetical protein